MAAPAPRGLALSSLFFHIAVVALFLLPPPARAIYCGEDDCYDLLGVTQSANTSEIKKAYYKLSLKHHPDKNPDPESKKLFVKIANAYEILKNEATREQYDYAIAHPEEVFYNTARYYHAYYGHKTDPRAVLIGLLLVVSAFQYLNQWSRYNQAIATVKKTPAYKNRLRALELERSGGVTNKKKARKQMDKKTEEELSNELQLQIQGAEVPSVWNLVGIRFLLLPYMVGKLLFWRGCWFWRYHVQKIPYSWNDACYLTQKRLGVPFDAWQNIEHARRRGANIIAEYLGGAITCDAYHMTNPRPDGMGIYSCILRGLEDAGVSPEEVNYINAHASSTTAGDLVEVNAIKKVFKDTSQIKMNGTKSMIGHCLGAAGALEAIVTIKAITTGWLHPTINQDDLEPEVTIDTLPHVKRQHEVHVAISNSFGFGGQNSVVVFAPFKP